MNIRKTIGIMLLAVSMTISAQVTPVSQMEHLDLGLVALPANSGGGNFVSWRLLGTDHKAVTTFDLLCDGLTVATGLTITNYHHAAGTAASRYQVVKRVDGEVAETSAPVVPWPQHYLLLQLDRPAGGVHASWDGSTNVPYAYYPCDMSVGDVDADGRYELFVKWESTHAQDNSYSKGYTGSTIIDCYKIADSTTEEVTDDGVTSNCKLLWRVDLGPNIRDGAHYTQFMVYDFDGDGRAEMMCKTATGSIDGTGRYVNQAATDATILSHPNTNDYRNEGGHILKGAEYLTVFDGLTGRALHTTWYLPGRAGTGSKLPSGRETTEGGSELGKVSTFPNGFWGDNYGNRSERFLAAVAYVNGADHNACAVFCRGYYSQAYVWAVSFDGERLHTEWLHASPSRTQWLVFRGQVDESQSWPVITVDGDRLQRNPLRTAPANTGGVSSSDGSQNAGSNTLFGNGNHNLSVADVDDDGCDEIIWGASALDDDGSLLYATGYGHGDAIHMGKMLPDRPGLQVFDVHEEKLTAAHGCWDLHDAATGEIIWHGGPADADNGRGMAADLTGSDGYEFWSASERNPRSALTGSTVINKGCSVNFRIYWDGSVQDQLFDGSYKYSNDLYAQASHAEPAIQKWNGSAFTTVASFYNAANNYAQTANYTKATPCLQADLLGDWREELILWNKRDSSQVMLFTTAIPTAQAVPTLMHDHTYRMGVAWQNTAYNQPPHLGYYLPYYVGGLLPDAVRCITMPAQQAPQRFDLQGRPLPAGSHHHGLVIERYNGRVKKTVISPN